MDDYSNNLTNLEFDMVSKIAPSMHMKEYEEGESYSTDSISEDDENISVKNLIHTEEEKLNFEMINHTIYSE